MTDTDKIVTALSRNPKRAFIVSVAADFTPFAIEETKFDAWFQQLDLNEAEQDLPFSPSDDAPGTSIANLFDDALADGGFITADYRISITIYGDDSWEEMPGYIVVLTNNLVGRNIGLTSGFNALDPYYREDANDDGKHYHVGDYTVREAVLERLREVCAVANATIAGRADLMVWEADTNEVERRVGDDNEIEISDCWGI